MGKNRAANASFDAGDKLQGIVVNSNTALGAVGYTTGFAPSMTLGPGSWGGSITSDNLTPLHLINLKRVGEEVRPYRDPLRETPAAPRVAGGASAGAASVAGATPEVDVRRIVDELPRRVPGGTAMTPEQLERLASLIAREIERGRVVADEKPRAAWVPAPVRPAPPERGGTPAPWTGAGQVARRRRSDPPRESLTPSPGCA